MLIGPHAGGEVHAEASLIAHEFGHCLGQNHGGGQGEESLWKLNYNSVMNYAFTGGIDTDHDAFGLNYDAHGPRDWPYPDDEDEVFTLDYSRGDRHDLKENSLNEALGVCGYGRPADWNEDGAINATPAKRKMTGFEIDSYVISDFDDWRNLIYLMNRGYGPGSPGGNKDNDVDNPIDGCLFFGNQLE